MSGCIGNDRTSGAAAIRVEEVGGAVDLAVVVVGSARTAETSTSAEDGGVGHEDGGGMVVTGDSLGRELGEGRADGIPHLGLELGCGVREGLAVDLTASDEDAAVRKDDGVGEGALVPHRVDVLDRCGSAGRVDCDDVRVGGCVYALVVDGAADGEDLALGCVVHDGVTAHSVTVVATGSCGRGAACSCCSIPVHVPGGTGLEDVSTFPAKEPAVVVGAVDTLGVVGEHGIDGCAGEFSPSVGSVAVELSNLVS